MRTFANLIAFIALMNEIQGIIRIPKPERRTVTETRNRRTAYFINDSKSSEIILQEAWEVANKEQRKDAKSKLYYYRIADQTYPKANTCEAYMSIMHKAQRRDTDEIRSLKYLTATSYIRNYENDVCILDKNIENLWKKIATQNKVCKKVKRKRRCRGKHRFRTIDGSCNNVYHTSWGKASTAQGRFFYPSFSDDVTEPRQFDKQGYPLPSPRKISNILSEGQEQADTSDDLTLTVYVPAWGQFLDHDITLTPLSEGKNGTVIKCCENKREEKKRRQCFPIDIPPNDEIFRGKTCMEFTRSRPTIRDGCIPYGYRDVLNAVTAFVDASNVYGSTSKLAKELRDGGKLKESNLGRHLPQADNDTCNVIVDGDFCKKGGDARVNEIPHLTMLHTAFVRLHNNIVDVLKVLNIKWRKRRLYQETRKIVGAIMQHITYTEFLPIILDRKLMKQYNIDRSRYKYDANLDPSIRNEFSTAAFRFGHSMIQTNQACLTKYFRSFLADEPLETQFFNPHLPQRCADGVARWASAFACKKMDSGFVRGVKDFLFLDNKNDSFDLVALNIQRGRDHGLPSYTDVRHELGLTCPSSFEDLKAFMLNATVARLQKAYRNVEDIDLFVGGVSEKPFGTGAVGETFGTLIALQFHVLKYGDRFWYENQSRKRKFTKAQLTTIRRIKLSDVLCECFNIRKLQRDVFEKVNSKNKRKRCWRWASTSNLRHWKKPRKIIYTKKSYT